MIRFLLIAIVMHLCSAESYSQSYVEVNGKKQFFVRKGSGQPAVIFINGLGTDLDNFGKIQKRISRNTLTVAYDRPGTGKSEAVESERSVDVLVAELHELIQKLKVEKGYILVGHSMGGYIMRLYAKNYKDELGGLLFIDPSHEDYFNSRKRIRSKAEQEELTRKAFDFPEYPPAAIRNEFKHFMTTDVELVKGAKIPDDIPVTILTAIRITDDEIRNGKKKEDLDIWLSLHRNWLKDALGIRHIVTGKSGHFIHDDEPELVVSEIELLIDKVKANMR